MTTVALRYSLRAALRREYTRASIHEVEPLLWRIAIPTDAAPEAVAAALPRILPPGWSVVSARRSPKRGRVSVTLSYLPPAAAALDWRDMSVRFRPDKTNN